ncbi:baseplate hub assembly catalyst [Synechococcus phage S-CAM9]|uniref:Baseplate hub assembly catalyst n=1 Tax=Synechococcus phage S-CAM9 TaxID=1883369 RepID=A0A1D8KNH2_9CAUD|nr:baseplate hub assembly catalyst [Synechococcus phage S-CAM9]AOV60157.1 baseplate hub assembly catalyst [Synechococcus phage S-CAM9]AOV60385.1 baseplate hub assembly catalyst [Synechococcus phage S-CAM9]AOV60613.1 baseplate hub assembly catalyst [Synechococcus phage S-CAM9]
MSAESYYELNFSLMQYHKYSLTEIENMMPFERDIYVALLKNYLESEKLKAQQEYGIN